MNVGLLHPVEFRYEKKEWLFSSANNSSKSIKGCKQ